MHPLPRARRVGGRRRALREAGEYPGEDGDVETRTDKMSRKKSMEKVMRRRMKIGSHWTRTVLPSDWKTTEWWVMKGGRRGCPSEKVCMVERGVGDEKERGREMRKQR